MKSVFEIEETLTAEEVLSRAVRAEALMSDPVLESAMKSAEADLAIAWLSTEAGEASKREECWAAIRGLEAVRRTLRIYVTDGEVARERLGMSSRQ